jgi:hypothetical protein
MAASASPTREDQPTFGNLDFLRKLAVPLGRPRLTLQIRGADFHVGEDFIKPPKVGFRRAEFLFGIFAAHMKPGNPCRFFQHRAAFGGLRGYDRADPALGDEGRGVRAGRRVREHQCHILRPDIPAIDPVGGARSPFDPADYLEIAFIALGIIVRIMFSEDRHLGKVSRGAAVGSGENHIFHRPAAQRFRAAFAHHPSDRLKQV